VPVLFDRAQDGTRVVRISRQYIYRGFVVVLENADQGSKQL
jgi:hypothetical protein